MDPNETLARIGKYLNPATRGRFYTGDDLDDDCAALFNWIERGGFEPDWSKYPLAASYYQCRVVACKRERP